MNSNFVEDKIPKVRDLYDDIKVFCQKYLWENDNAKSARQFLEDRKITKDVCDTFQIGYLPQYEEWSHIVSSKERQELLGISSLLEMTERLMLPMCTGFGETRECVGYIGRRLLYDTSPMYIQSYYIKQSDSFCGLYGFFEGLREIEKERVLVLCEGPMDLLSLHSAGIKTCCAFLYPDAYFDFAIGTIEYYCDKVFYAFDNDNYGKSLANKIAQALNNKKIIGQFVDLGSARDVAEYYLQNGSKALNALLV